MILAQRSQVLLGINPAQVVIGELGNEGFWLSVASDPTINVPTGVAVTASVYGHGGRDTLIIPYGQFLTQYVEGSWIEVTGNGATFELIASTKKIDVAPQTITPPAVTAVTVSGSVSAAIVGPIDGVTGGVKVDVVGPLYKPGVVDVHDTGV